MRTSLVNFALAPAVILAAAFAVAPPANLHGQGVAAERTLYVTALDAKGELVDGLGPSDFIVREDGVQREVLRVSRAVEPIDIALLVDNGATADREIVNIREGLKTFISMMAGENAVALVALADRPTIVVDYTTDPKRLLEGVGRLFAQAQSGVTLLDAIVEVSRGVEKRESARSAIIPLLTDSVDFSNRNYRDALDAFERSGAVLHTLMIGTFDFTRDDPFKNRGVVLDQGARASGGQRISLLAATAVESTLRRLARELSSQYKVVYGRSQMLVPPAKIEISPRRAGVTMRGTPARRQSGA